MNQRGAVRAVSIVSGLAIVIGVVVLPSLKGFVGAADDSAECDLPGAILIDVKHETSLLNPNALGVDEARSLIIIPLTGGKHPDPIVAGIYSVTLVSFDKHSEGVPRPEQTKERWFVRLLDDDLKPVYESPSTPDLEDEKNLRSDTFVGVKVERTATKLHAVHHLAKPDPKPDRNINSIHAVCAVFVESLPIDLVVTLDDAPRGEAPKEPIVTPGAPFDYVVNVLNLGPEGAHNVEAVLTLSDEVVVDTAALDPACVPAGTDEIVCSIGAVPVGEIIKVRVAVGVRGDSPGIGTLVSSVIVGDEGSRDVEPTTFPVANGIG